MRYYTAILSLQIRPFFLSHPSFFIMASNANNAEYAFIKKPSQKYYCPVTGKLLADPRQTNECCGKHLSRAAAEQLEAEGKPCPLCKKAPLKTTKDLFFKRKVMELQAYCSKKSAGCQNVTSSRASAFTLTFSVR